jgi:hypothetical protein
MFIHGKKGRYTLAAHLPGFFGKRGRELGPCIMGEKGMSRGKLRYVFLYPHYT